MNTVRKTLLEKLELEVRKLRHAIPLSQHEWDAQLEAVSDVVDTAMRGPTHLPDGKGYNVKVNGVEVCRVVEARAGEDGYVMVHKLDAHGNYCVHGGEFVTEILHGNVEITEAT